MPRLLPLRRGRGKLTRMPAQSPFTLLCQLAVRSPNAGRADLHLHTTYSDGTYTPAQIVDLGRRSGLSALAITDHDTIGAVADARRAATGSSLEVIAGVEITTEFHGKELHLLAYFFDEQNLHLGSALEKVRSQRAGRFQKMVQKLRDCGVVVDTSKLAGATEALGRRHLAELLIEAGAVHSHREAFTRWLGDGGRAEVPKYRLPVAEAIAAVRAAGGVTSWAHPSANCDLAALTEMRAFGLSAVEVEYPELKRSRTQQLRAWAERLEMAISGGSDCHGPGKRTVGACSVSAAELEVLRRSCSKFKTVAGVGTPTPAEP